MPKIRLFRPQIRRAIRGAIGPAAIGFLENLVARKSWHETQELGRRIGRFGYRHHRRYRSKCEENLRTAYGDELTGDQIDDIVRRYFEHVVMMFLELLRLPSMDHEELAEVSTIRGLEHYEDAIAQGNGVVILAGHLGNWEVGALHMLQEGLPIIPLSRTPKSPRLARSILRLREKMGFPIIPISEGVRGIMRALKKNQCVPILPDQFAWGNGLTVPYFGQPTHVWHTPALMAQRTGCQILPVLPIRQEDGTICTTLLPPVEQIDTGDRDFDLWVNTARCMAAIESGVRQYPAQYFWHYHFWRPGHEFPPPYPFERLEELL